MKWVIAILLFANDAHARSTLYTAEKSADGARGTITQPLHNASAETSKTRSWSMIVRGNPIVSASGLIYRELSLLKAGDLLFARVPHSVVAFGEGKAPVSARVSIDGRDFVLLGNATLEKASKRILLNFTKLREVSSDETFDVLAEGMALNGTLGVEGEYVSGESKLFAAELAAATAAGFADASIVRNTNVLGQVQEEVSLDTKSKKALGTALSRTADRFAEKQKQSPEYSKLTGPVALKILIVDPPKRKL